MWNIVSYTKSKRDFKKDCCEATYFNKKWRKFTCASFMCDNKTKKRTIRLLTCKMMHRCTIIQGLTNPYVFCFRKANRIIERQPSAQFDKNSNFSRSLKKICILLHVSINVTTAYGWQVPHTSVVYRHFTSKMFIISCSMCLFYSMNLIDVSIWSCSELIKSVSCVMSSTRRVDFLKGLRWDCDKTREVI